MLLMGGPRIKILGSVHAQQMEQENLSYSNQVCGFSVHNIKLIFITYLIGHQEFIAELIIFNKDSKL